MTHPASYLLLFGGFVLILGIVLAFSRFFENRRRRATEFRNYFCSGFERDLFPFAHPPPQFRRQRPRHKNQRRLPPGPGIIRNR